jgi:hypothetical protein
MTSLSIYRPFSTPLGSVESTSGNDSSRSNYSYDRKDESAYDKVRFVCSYFPPEVLEHENKKDNSATKYEEANESVNPHMQPPESLKVPIASNLQEG